METEIQTNKRVKLNVTNFSASKHRLKAVHFTIVLSAITTATNDCCVCWVIATNDSFTCVKRWLSSSTACLLSTMCTQSDNISIQLATSAPLISVIIDTNTIECKSSITTLTAISNHQYNEKSTHLSCF